MSKPTIGFRLFRDGAKMPTRATTHAAGWDLYAWVENNGVVEIAPHKTVLVKTGLNVELPIGYEMSVRPRSGLAIKNNLTILNSPGLIDCDYSNVGEEFEIRVVLHNADDKLTQFIKHGDRIAQATFHEVPDVDVVELDRDVIPHESNRAGGFGSTGI